MKRKAGYLIVKTFVKLYHDYVGRDSVTHDWYAVPRIDRTPEEQRIQYKGIDRGALSPLPVNLLKELPRDRLDTETAEAEVRLAELEESRLSFDGFLFRLQEASEVYDLLGEAKRNYELIWCRLAGSGYPVPPSFRSIGYEPSYFDSDHFSASCDAMMFPRWHGTDEEGKLFASYFAQLNRHGLFGTAEQAKDFLKYYLSFDWTETGKYKIVEVFIERGDN